MKKLKLILLLAFLLFAGTSLYPQIKNQDKGTDRNSSLKQLDVTMPKMDLSGFDDMLKQIEPMSTSATIYNDQLLEGAVDLNKYIVGPSDIFSLGIWGVINQPLPLAVSPEGSLIVPTVGEINVAGLTLNEAKQKVIDRVKKRFISAEITLTLVSPRRFTITVTGVGQGIYPVSAIMRASTIISFIFSDSVSLIKSGTQPFERPNFSLRNITLKHKNGQTQRIDLFKYYATQDEKYNPFLNEGDVINLPKYDWDGRFISVQGAVQYPGVFEYIEGDDLETALQLVRGVTSVALLDSIMIARLDPTATKMERIYVKFEESKHMKLQPDDRVMVSAYAEERRDFKVLVLGEVVRGGYYPITKNNTKLSDVIAETGGLTPSAYLPTSELYRKVDTLSIQGGKLGDSLETFYTMRLNDVLSSKDERENFSQDLKYKIGRVNVDFEKLWSGDESQNITVHNGDIIYISDNKKQVYVYGQVNKPGYVPFKEGADYTYYINAAGGYADRANQDEIRIIKFKTREWQEPDKAKIQSNDFVYVPKIIKRDFAYDIDLVSKVASVIVSVVTLTLVVIQSQK
jgi:polysaccharide export outer membrane protein